MTEEMKFFLYLLEQYAAHRRQSTAAVLRQWDERRLTREIFENHWGYHTESLQNALDDIDSLLRDGTHRI